MSDVSIACPSDDRADADRRAYEATRNPVYLFMALGRYGAREPLPLWIRRYLLEATKGVLLASAPENGCPAVPALQYVLRAMGFVRPGWNAVLAYRQDREDGFVATIYGLTATKGRTKVAAYDLGNPRSVRRKVAKIRRMRDQVS